MLRFAQFTAKVTVGKKDTGSESLLKSVTFADPGIRETRVRELRGEKKYNTPYGWHSVEVIARQQLLAKGEERKLYTQISPQPVVTLPKYFRASSSPKIIKKRIRGQRIFFILYTLRETVGWDARYSIYYSLE